MNRAMMIFAVLGCLAPGCAVKTTREETLAPQEAQLLTEEQVTHYVGAIPGLVNYLAKRDKSWFAPKKDERAVTGFQERIDHEIRARRLSFRSKVKRLGYANLDDFAAAHALIWQAYTCAVIRDTQAELQADVETGNVRRLDDRGHPLSDADLALALSHARSAGTGVPDAVRANADVVAPHIEAIDSATETE